MKMLSLDPKRLARAAIKESFDNLPMGLCFSDWRGIPMLINHSMSHLSHLVTGKALQDARAFWQTVTQGDLAEGTERLQYGASPVLCLPDGTVWAFSRSTMHLDNQPITQIVAADMTELDEAHVRLDAANRKLKTMNDRLTARITNDGTPPQGELNEGGGLSALRHSLETNGGTLTIRAAPMYQMTVTIPLFGEVS